MSIDGGSSSEIDVKEYIKIFGRLGEKMIFGDSSAGLCCHSACDDCEWRYTFDVLQSARPKWIPTYRENKFEDGREHIAKWSGIFEGEEPVNKEQFNERLAAIKFEMPLGPAGFLTAKQAELSPEALDAFWHYISRGKPTLTPKQFSIRLKKMLGSPDGDDGVFLQACVLCAHVLHIRACHISHQHAWAYRIVGKTSQQKYCLTEFSSCGWYC
jgi:hypothetical protein